MFRILRDGPTALLRMRAFSSAFETGPSALLRMKAFLSPHPEVAAERRFRRVRSDALR